MVSPVTVMSSDYERFTISQMADILQIPESTVRSACNRSHLQRDGDEYLLPCAAGNPQRVRFLRLTLIGPQSIAEQLRRDLGCRLPRR